MTARMVRLVAVTTTDYALQRILELATTSGVDLVELNITGTDDVAVELEELRARNDEFAAEADNLLRRNLELERRFSEVRSSLLGRTTELVAQRERVAELERDLGVAHNGGDEAEACVRELEPPDDVLDRLRNPVSYDAVRGAGPLRKVELVPLTSPAQAGDGEPLTLDEPKVWPCPNGCGKTFDTASGVGGHRRWCNRFGGGAEHRCPHCNAFYEDADRLSGHLEYCKPKAVEAGDAGVAKVKRLLVESGGVRGGEAEPVEPAGADVIDIPVTPRRPNVLGLPTARALHPLKPRKPGSTEPDRPGGELPKDTLTRSELLKARGYDQ